MANGDDLIRELSQDIGFLRASPEEQRQYLQFKDPNFPKDEGQQEAYRQRMHTQAVTARNAAPGQFETEAAHKPYYGFTPGNVGRNVVRGAGELAGAGLEMGKDILFPQGKTESERLGYLGKKYIADPFRAEQARAREVEGTQGTLPAIGHRLASVVPLAGPWAASLGEQAGTGDVGGALARGGTQVLAAKYLIPRVNATELGRRMIPGGGGAEPLLRWRTPRPPGGGGGAPGGGAPGGGAPGGAAATPEPEPLRPLPGPVEGPRLPTTVEALDAATQQFFPGRRFGDLSTEQQSLVMRSQGERTAGGRAGEERVLRGTSPTGQERRAEAIRPGTITPTMPVERRAPGGQPMGAPPGGIERRQPTQAERDWDQAFSTSAVTGQPMPGETLAQTIAGAGETIPPDMEGRVVQRLMQSGRWPQFKGLDTRGQSAMAREVRDEILREQKAPGGLPTTPGIPAVPGAPGAVPAAPGPTTLTPVKGAPGAVPRGPITPEGAPAGANVPQGTAPTLDEILRKATGQPEPLKPKPGVPLGEQLGKE